MINNIYPNQCLSNFNILFLFPLSLLSYQVCVCLCSLPDEYTQPIIYLPVSRHVIIQEQLNISSWNLMLWNFMRSGQAISLLFEVKCSRHFKTKRSLNWPTHHSMWKTRSLNWPTHHTMWKEVFIGVRTIPCRKQKEVLIAFRLHFI